MKIVNLHSYTGHIPRYRNWNLTTAFTRPFFRSHLLNVKDAYIDVNPLQRTDAEALLKVDGFKASSYAKFLNNYRPLTTMESMPLLELMRQMSPIYWVFGMIPCPQLYNSNAQEKYKELVYEDEDETPEDTSVLPVLTPTTATKLCEGVRVSEWRNYIRKKLAESRKYMLTNHFWCVHFIQLFKPT